jgi:two-component system chemotaxis response regulator CheY
MPSTVLIIDDNSVIRQILRLRFQQKGWKVEEARDAYEGLTKFRETAPQLVTLDLIMPINQGIGATQLARMILEEDPRVILLVVSSLGNEADFQEFCRKYGIELFAKASVQDPTFDTLFDRVDRLSEKLSSTTKVEIERGL